MITECLSSSPISSAGIAVVVPCYRVTRHIHGVVAVIRDYIDDENGPLIYPRITEAPQRSFDAICRKLHCFFGVLGLTE